MPKPLPISQALEFASPSTVLPCFSESERADFARELSILGNGYPHMGYEADIADVHGYTLGQLTQHLMAPGYEVITGNCGMDMQRRSSADVPLVRRFLHMGAKHYAKDLSRLTIERARLQVISDTATNPVNIGGYGAHTDSIPWWDKVTPRAHRDSYRLCIAVCSIDPGTVVCRLNRPLPYASPLASLMRRKVRRNKGPNPKTFMRALRRSPGLASVAENRGGDATAFNGESVHWRSHEGRNKPSAYRTFAVLDLYIPKTRHNEGVIRALLAKRKHRPARIARPKNASRALRG